MNMNKSRKHTKQCKEKKKQTAKHKTIKNPKTKAQKIHININ